MMVIGNIRVLENNDELCYNTHYVNIGHRIIYYHQRLSVHPLGNKKENRKTNMESVATPAGGQWGRRLHQQIPIIAIDRLHSIIAPPGGL